jgi:DNA-binding CsgD family transcriptional regulator
MQGRPLAHESKGARRKRTCDKLALEVDRSGLTDVPGVEMRPCVCSFVPIHPDRDPVEEAEPRHAASVRRGLAASRTHWECGVPLKRVPRHDDHHRFELAVALRQRATSKSADGPRRPDLGTVLTACEREVAAVIARGLTNREIAHELVIRESTVEVHVSTCSAI